ncbi:Fic family protein [Metabacillus idriensis]|uniref:Fic family protein n=1 Tax=Metabacillus idriensis TaxID=324768 RepID=UPI00174A7A7D|nr:Fic family protein [Metabacillus idriensis]
MNYEKLSKVFYKEPEEYELEYQKRYNGYGSYRTNLQIKPILKGRHLDELVELFIVNIDPLMKLQEEIFINSFTIRDMVRKMPPAAVQPYFNKLLINELQSTNEIEGIRSTKKELSEILLHLNEKKQTSKVKRFNGLLKTYKYIDKIQSFEKIEDFRKLYDDIVADEIPDKEQPDGHLFRKESVNITDGNRATHVGVYPESSIKEYLSNLLIFLKTSDTPDLYKYMIAHYYYEYIHPFYDGNGRTGRLFVSSYIKKKLDPFTAVSLSYTINQDKQKYYKALEELSNPKNKGEATFYCQSMLEILKDGQESLIEDLSLGLEKVKKIHSHLKSLEWADADTKKVLGTLLNINIFAGHVKLLSNVELQENLQFKRYKINRILKDLETRGIVKKLRQRPTIFDLEEDFVDEVLS